MKNRNMFWGLIFIIIALLIIANQFGLFGGINIFSLVITILLIPIIVISAKNRNVGGVLLPLGIILILYSKQLGLDFITPWPIILSVIFLSVGLSFFIKPKTYSYNNHFSHFDETSAEHLEEGVINITAKLSSCIKYIDSDNLKTVNIYCSCCGAKIYFDNAKIQDDEAVLNIESRCSGVELYIPKTWKVTNQLNCIMGGVEQKGVKVESENPKKLILKGNVNLSGVSIIYV